MAEPPWNPTKLPGADDKQFLKYVEKNTTRASIFEPSPDEMTGWDKSPNADSYASFGDNGMTASVDCYGNLMQFARFLGVGRSGMFSVDHLIISEPYSVRARAEDLRSLWDPTFRTYGTELVGLQPREPPKLRYVHGRWPRFEYQIKDRKLGVIIQWIVRGDILFQQMTLHNSGTEQSEIITVECDQSFFVRELNHLTINDRFGANDETYRFHVGPCGVSYVTANRRRFDNREEPEAVSTRADMPGERRAESGDSALESIAVVASIFVNGEALKWRLQSEENDWEINSWKATIDAGDHVEVVTSYRMIPIPASGLPWERFVISAQEADVNAFLASEKLLYRCFDSIGVRLVELRQNEAESLGSTTTAAPDHEAEDAQPPAKRLELRPSPVVNDIPSLSELPVDHVEYLLRRHLEHILSVCAIPVRSQSEIMGLEKPVSDSEPTPIALTCGDMSDHRICTSASFFAFQFLLTMRERLNLAASTPYTKALCARIDTVCRGHIAWLAMILLAEKEPATPKFKANYWVTGNEIERDEDDTRIPPDALTDTPFHLIKIADFSKVYKTDRDLNLALSVLKRTLRLSPTSFSGPALGAGFTSTAESRLPKPASDEPTSLLVTWGGSLTDEPADKRRLYAWPRGLDEGVNFFRLDDHLWVWRALKSIEETGLDIWHGDKLARQLRSTEVQREVLGRFTTINDVSGKRMLAVTRSARDTRFMFHARDTVLFYAIDWGLPLLEGTLHDVWNNTIEAQQHHELNNETNWDNALRYSLAFVMGSRKYKINKRPPGELAASALRTLLKSTSHNGFFGGQLNMTTKEPMLFKDAGDRDFYFHASFETPFVLLKEWSGFPDVLSDWNKTLKTKKLNGTQSRRAHISQTPQSPAASLPSPGPLHSLEELLERLTAQTKRHSPLDEEGLEHGRKRISMEKYIPFTGTFVDPSSLNEIAEEWLYNYPAFLQNRKTLEEGYVVTQLQALVGQGDSAINRQARRHMDIRRKGGDWSFSSSGPAWSHVLNAKRRRDTRERESEKRRDKRKRQIEKQKNSNPPTNFSNRDLWEALKQPRTVREAKKRFIWLPRATNETALICYLTSAEPEKPEMFLFFDRHRNQENYFVDDPTAIYNKWESELHLSFYHVVDAVSEKPAHGIPIPVPERFPGNSGKCITRASIGFRFDGDFFDRYWTCHFIEFLPRDSSDPDLKSLGFEFSDESSSWQQRKVLELKLFDRMISQIVDNAQLILEEARAELKIKPGTMSSVLTILPVLSSDAYFSTRDRWQRLLQILQAVDDDIASILGTISKWERRERDRGLEKPRWTSKDESKYRGELRKLSVSTARKTRDLQAYHVSITALKDKLVEARDNVRNDLSLLGAENIRFFTYVTVIFLPLGFATSIYSMSDSPPVRDNVISMVIFAVCALTVTAVALFNAKTMTVILERISSIVEDYSLRKMDSSYLVRQHRERKSGIDYSTSKSAPRAADEERALESTPPEPGMKPVDPDEHEAYANVKRRSPSVDRSLHIDFWFAYLIVELPARRVMQALETLKNPELSLAAFSRLVLGMIILPLFVLSWVIRIVGFNVLDLFKLVFASIKRILPSNTSRAPDGDSPFDRRMRTLTVPPDSQRPLRKVLRSMESDLTRK